LDPRQSNVEPNPELIADPVTAAEVVLEWVFRLYLLPFRVLSLLIVWAMIGVWKIVLMFDSRPRLIHNPEPHSALPNPWTTPNPGLARSITRLG
jgi:hypothetical protein